MSKTKWFIQLSTFLVCAALVLIVILQIPTKPAYAELYNGAPAIDLLGQYDQVDMNDPQPIYTKGGTYDTPGRMNFVTNAMLMDTLNHRFFVADRSGNRILIYNLNINNTFPDYIPDNILGQSNYYTTTVSTTQNSLNTPEGLAYDSVNNRLFVSQSAANRVSVFDLTIVTDNEPAINVLGQPDFTSSAFAITQEGMRSPKGLAYDSVNSRLFVAQDSGNRVTVYDVTTISNGESAINVLGQTDFTTGTSGLTQSKFNAPRGLAYDPLTSRLYVAEGSNNRVTVFDVAAITNGENAINVLGQPNFTTNSTTISQAKTSFANGLALNAAGDRLYVVQQFSHSRVTVFDVATITDGENALNVLGQPNFTNTSSANDLTGLPSPTGAAYDPTNNLLFISIGSSGLGTVRVFDVVSITNGEAAVSSFGFDSTLGFSSPQKVTIDYVHHRLFVVDGNGGRVLVYNLNNDNTLPDRVPDFVLGQSSLSTVVTVAANQSNLRSPKGVAYDPINNRLFVSQGTFAHRVSVFDVTTIVNGEPAINVLGQPDFTTNTGGRTQSKLSSPDGLIFDPTTNHLFVADSTNQRVMIFDVAAITDGENAINVLGQSDFTTADFTASQTVTTYPNGLALDPSRDLLFVGQGNSNRVTVFDVATITDGEPAINVLGQSNFTNTSSSVSQAGLNAVTSLALDPIHNYLYVGQTSGNRVSVFDVNIINDGELAINVLGQPNFTTSTASLTQAGFESVFGVFYDESNEFLYVSQTNNSNRISIFDVTAPGFTVTESAGSTEVVEGGATDTFDLVLTLQPDSDVTFNITPSDSSINVSDSTVTFTNGNWNIPQIITVTAAEDFNVTDDTPTITISVDDGTSDIAFRDLFDQLINVTTTDNDTASYSFNTSTNPFAITEGGSGTFTVVLNTQPLTDVVFDIVSGNPQAQISPTSLTFTSINWNIPQTVTVSISEDDNYINEFLSVFISVNAALSDDNFDGLLTQQVTIAVDDNDNAPGGSAKFGQPACSGSACENNPETPTTPESPTNPEIPTPPVFGEFSDISNHWARIYIEILAQKCDVQGYLDEAGNRLGLFGPDNNITRAELIKILITCQNLTLSTSSEQIFSDVFANNWFSPYIHTAFEKGLVEGYNDGTFRPNINITREEAIKVILLSKFSESEILASSEPFTDVPENQWYSKYISFAYSQGFINGYKNLDGTLKNLFGLGDNLTRGEAAKVIVEVLDL